MKAIPFLLLFLAGCASYKSYNQTTTGKVVLRGGIYQKESWKDPLIFKRMSWYYGMTLYFDALIYRADSGSPFSKWFSEILEIVPLVFNVCGTPSEFLTFIIDRI